MAAACYCHVEGHPHHAREERRAALTGSRYHEHRCECVCGCNRDTLGYGFCPYCHFEHAKMRGQTLGVLALPIGEAPRPAWWKPELANKSRRGSKKKSAAGVDTL